MQPEPQPSHVRRDDHDDVPSGSDRKCAPSTSLPFGISVAAREPIHTELIDEAALVWDREQQIMLVREGEALLPWMRHTDGVTNTDSNTDGSGGRETDEDHRED